MSFIKRDQVDPFCVYLFLVKFISRSIALLEIHVAEVYSESVIYIYNCLLSSSARKHDERLCPVSNHYCMICTDHSQSSVYYAVIHEIIVLYYKATVAYTYVYL